MAVTSAKQTGRPLNTIEGLRIVAAAKLWAGTPYGTKGGSYAGAGPVKKKGADCSGSTWKIYQEAGFSYGGYVNTATFKDIVGTDANFIEGKHFFKQVAEPQVGDVGWWSGHMVIYDPALAQDSALRGLQQKPGSKSVWSASSPTSTRTFGPAWSHWYDGGRPATWYRYHKAAP